MTRSRGMLALAGRLIREAISSRRVVSPGFPYDTPKVSVLSPASARAGCNICFNSCTTRVYLDGGRVVSITGHDGDPVTRGRLCAKGQLLVQMQDNPYRLRYPQKRTGRRGQGRFVRIGWEQGLDELAAALDRVRKEYGPEALAVFSGTRSGLLSLHGVAALFTDCYGTPNFSGTNPFCATGADLAFEMTQGVSMGNSGNAYTDADLGSSDFYLFIGDNMAETRPVNFGLIQRCRLAQGARMVVVDPRQTVTASKADEWHPIRPGTDMALGLAMIYHVIARGLVSSTFVGRWVEGYEQIERFVLERGYTPEWASRITDLPAATIARLAEEYASADRAVIFACRGITQHSNSVQSSRVFMILAAIAGNWGKPGAGVMLIGSSLPIGAAAPFLRPPGMRRAVRRSPAGWIEAMRDGRPYPIRALIMTGNPLSLWPGQTALREALQRLDIVAHLELFPNESSAYADYVFPMASGIECGEVNRLSEDRRVVWIDKLVDPPGEAKPDYWFWIELGKRLGFSDVLKDAYKDPAVLWDETMIGHPLVREMTVARLRHDPRGWVRGPLQSEDSQEIETLFLEGSSFPGAPAGRRFPTPSGKLELWTEQLDARLRQYGLSALPEFYAEPEGLIPLPHLEYLTPDTAEGIESPFWADRALSRTVRIVERSSAQVEGYDTELVTGRPPAVHFHSWTHFFWQAQEACPDLFVHIHPEKAATHGIRSGDRVVIESPRGAIEAVARVDPGIRRTAIFVPLGWDERQPYHPWKAVNRLLPAEQRCPVSDQTNFKATVCRIRKG